MLNSLVKLGDLPERTRKMRMITWSHQKRSLAMKRAVEKREASYKWGIDHPYPTGLLVVSTLSVLHIPLLLYN